jgi:hypothetical protein
MMITNCYSTLSSPPCNRDWQRTNSIYSNAALSTRQVSEKQISFCLPIQDASYSSPSFIPSSYNQACITHKVFVPYLALDGRRISPRHTFVPLRSQPEVHTSLLQPLKQNRSELQDFSPVNMKLSPTQTILTTSTMESFDETSIEQAKRNVDQCFCPIKSVKAENNFEISSSQRALWRPPNSISFCSQVEKENQVYHHRNVTSLVPYVGAFIKPDSASIVSNIQGEQDSIRKSRMKTEMCLHYINKTCCPFGLNCTYAHGEEELQLTKLIDLHEAGLVDASTYRTTPCLAFVSTGSW